MVTNCYLRLYPYYISNYNGFILATISNPNTPRCFLHYKASSCVIRVNQLAKERDINPVKVTSSWLQEANKMEFLPLIVECHKRENWELYTSLCFVSLDCFVQKNSIPQSVAGVCFSRQPKRRGHRGGDENRIDSPEANALVSPSS